MWFCDFVGVVWLVVIYLLLLGEIVAFIVRCDLLLICCVFVDVC